MSRANESGYSSSRAMQIGSDESRRMCIYLASREEEDEDEEERSVEVTLEVGYWRLEVAQVERDAQPWRWDGWISRD